MGGVGGRGLIPNRPHDRVGVGMYWLKESGDLDAQPGELFDDELGIEAFYNVALTASMHLTFDVQWIDQGLAANSDATVLGLRLFTAF
ncbi:MAG: carbohydrate porin [Planctomycetes bacterium]|nr:carbohydrate porin [Planctomycetota bacterium]